MFLNVFDNIREARMAGERLDCGFNETSLVRKIGKLSGRKRKAYSIFELSVYHRQLLKCNFFLLRHNLHTVKVTIFWNIAS